MPSDQPPQRHRSWIKLWVEPWFMRSTRFDCSAAERGTWVDFLVLSARCTFPGTISAPNADGTAPGPVPVAWIAGQLCIPEDDVRSALDKFEQQEKVKVERSKTGQGLDAVLVTISNWTKYQSEYLRQKRYRQKLAAEPATVKPERTQPKLQVPEWIPTEAWVEFMETRKKLRAPNTDGALNRLVSRLGKLRAAGHDPAEVLGQSIERGWRGLFEISGTATSRQKQEDREYGERVGRIAREVSESMGGTPRKKT